MPTFRACFADVVVAADVLHESTVSFCADYLVGETEPAGVSAVVTQPDIDFERQKSAREDQLVGIPVRQFSDAYLETLALYRQIACGMLSHDVLLMHGSCVAVDGRAYLFVASSGTGKSTHVRLWRELLGDRAVVINDDKPLVRVGETYAIAYGTPWDGKHRVSQNASAKLAGICVLGQGPRNRIERLSPEAAYATLLQQSFRPADAAGLARAMALAARIADQVPLWNLSCLPDLDAARLSYDAMSGREAPGSVSPAAPSEADRG